MPNTLLYRDYKDWPFSKKFQAYLQITIQRYSRSYHFRRIRLSMQNKRSITNWTVAVEVCEFKFAQYIKNQEEKKVESALKDELFGINTKFINQQWKKAVQQVEHSKKISKIIEMVKKYVYWGQQDHLEKIRSIYHNIIPHIKLQEIGGLPLNLKSLFQVYNLTQNQIIKRERFNNLNKILSTNQSKNFGSNNYFRPSQVPTVRDRQIMKVVNTFFKYITSQLLQVQSSTYFSPWLNLTAANQKTLPFCSTFSSAKVIRATCQRLKLVGYSSQADEYFQAVIQMQFHYQTILKKGTHIYRLVGRALTFMGDLYKIKLKEDGIQSQQQFNVNWLCVKQKKKCRSRWNIQDTHVQQKRDQTYIQELLRLGFPLIAVIGCTEEEFTKIVENMNRNTIVPAKSIVPPDQAYKNNVQPKTKRIAHAVVIAGYDDFQGVYYILNSWGSAVGAEGFHAFQVGFPFREVYHLYDIKTEQDHPKRYMDPEAEKKMKSQDEDTDKWELKVQLHVAKAIQTRKSSLVKLSSSLTKTCSSLSKSKIIETTPPKPAKK